MHEHTLHRTFLKESLVCLIALGDLTKYQTLTRLETLNS